MNHRSVSPWAVRGLYFFSFVLVASPLLDLVVTIWPLNFGDLGWRYGALGLAAGYFLTPMLGLVLALAVAFWRDDDTALKGLGVLLIAGGTLLLLLTPVFLLDVIEMRAVRAPEEQRAVLYGGVIQGLKYATAALVLGALGLGSFKTASRRRSTGRSRGDASATG